MLNKLFPQTDYGKIKYDVEGLYSITNYYEADLISKIILQLFNDTSNLTIMDGTGGIGGNSISFCKFFKEVTTLEIDNDRCEILKNNINLYEYKNIKILNEDSINYLFKNSNKYNIYFFDPPWGGRNYKKNNNLILKIGNYYLSEIINKLKETTCDKLVIFKLPFNYNFMEFNCYNYKLYKINKYYIIIILI